VDREPRSMLFERRRRWWSPWSSGRRVRRLDFVEPAGVYAPATAVATCSRLARLCPLLRRRCTRGPRAFPAPAARNAGSPFERVEPSRTGPDPPGAAASSRRLPPPGDAKGPPSEDSTEKARRRPSAAAFLAAHTRRPSLGWPPLCRLVRPAPSSSPPTPGPRAPRSNYDRIMFAPGEIVSYLDMCREEGLNLQRGMNFGENGRRSLMLMSRRRNTLTMITSKTRDASSSTRATTRRRSVAGKSKDRRSARANRHGDAHTQNGIFFEAARQHGEHALAAERIRVYKKIRTGICVYNGVFALVDA
jgi:hypothetical protein